MIDKANVGGTVHDINDTGARGMISPDVFSTAAAYEAGEYCIYNNTLYKFTEAKSAGAWDDSKASATDIASELSALNSRIDSRIIQSEIFKGDVACEANVQKMVTDYTIPEGYALIAFDFQVYGTSLVSKMVSIYHTNVNIYMCVDVAQTYKVTIVATYLKS